MQTARLRATLAAFTAVAAATLVFALPASAATKPYSLVICAFGMDETCAPSPALPNAAPQQPAGVPAESVPPAPPVPPVPMSAAFLNENKAGTGLNLGSANLTAPAGFTVNGASLGGSPLAACTPSTPSTTSCLNGNTIELRSVGLVPGGTMTLNMTVTPPTTLAACTVGSPCAWAVVSKQSNDFSGSPGNDLSVDPSTSTLNTVLAQPQFTAQPANAAMTPTAITAQPFAPAAGPVTVTVVDANGARVGSYNGQVTVSLNPAAFATTQGTLHGTVASNAVAGVATFSDLSVDSPGNAYSLNAMAADLPPTATSSTFDIAQAGETCDSKQACKQLEAGSANFVTTDEGIDVTASATATTGSLALSVDFGNLTAGQCEGYTAQHYEFLDLTAPGTETDTITTTVLFGSVTNTTIKNQDLCFASKLQFTERNETTQPTSLTPASPTTLPDGSPGFSGLVADCAPRGKKPTGLQVDPTTQPCVLSRSGTSNPMGGGTLSITSSSPIDSYKGG